MDQVRELQARQVDPLAERKAARPGVESRAEPRAEPHAGPHDGPRADHRAAASASQSPAFGGGSAEATTLLGAALETMAQGIVFIDSEFRVAAMNKRVWDFVPEYRDLYKVGADIRGVWRASAAAGHYGSEISDPDALVRQMTDAFLRRKRYRFERTSANDTLMQVDLRPVEEFSGWVVTYTDISERRKTETALAQSAENMRTILQNVADGLFALDRSGAIHLFNAKAEEIFGYSAKEMIGQNASILVPDNIAEDYAVRIQEYLHTDKQGVIDIGQETIGRRKDGVEFPLGIGIGYVPLGDDDLFVVSVRDIGETKAAEARLQHGKRLESLGQLVGGIAHEFNNLLTSISGFTEMAIKKADNKERVLEYLGEVAEVSKRAVTLTGQMLAFGRKQIVKKEVVSVGQALLAQESLIRVSLDAATELSFEVADDGNCVEIDPGQLSQCVMNLVGNARHAMPEGGRVVIRYQAVDVAADRVTSHGETLCVGRYALVKVSDTGTGMEQEVLARLFDPFYTTKERGKGTGLGLSLVYGMVANSGGVIDVESEPRAGSSFSIYLPIVARDAAAEGGGGEDEPSTLPAPRCPVLLVVDDDAHVRRFAEVTLEDEGYHVLVARDGEEAISVHKDHVGKIDLLVTDVVMPKMGGVDLATALVRAQPGLRVIFMSGYTAETSNQVNEFASDGNFLQKPFHSEEMIELVTKYVPLPGTAEASPESGERPAPAKDNSET